jgi:WD40 repeat protein
LTTCFLLSLVYMLPRSFLISTSLDTTIKVWDLREGQLFYTLHGHEGATMAAAFSPAGDYFATAGRGIRGGGSGVVSVGLGH